MDLAALQRGFKQTLLMPGDDDYFLAEIRASKVADKQRGLDIYRNNIKGACLKALGQVYPVCRRVLGEDVFLRAARGYAVTHPSDSANLNDYGSKFADFLNVIKDEQAKLKPFPFLSDLAGLEWAVHCAYNSPGNESFDYKALTDARRQDDGRLIFTLSVSLTLLSSPYPLAALWRSDGSEPLSLSKRTEYLCVHRKLRRPDVVVVNKADYHLLLAVQNRVALAQLARDHPDVHLRLSEWVQAGWICGFHYSAADDAG